MPIRFRCTYCNRLLGIATRKAGTETTCPHCGYTITVPVPQDDDVQTERVNLDDVDRALGNSTTEVVAKSAVAAPAAPPTAPVAEKSPESRPAPVSPSPAAKVHPAAAPAPKKAPPAPAPAHPEERPLFEQDVDDILGRSTEPEEPQREKPPPVSGMDAMNLSEPPHQIVISAQKATLLMILVVVLMAISFVAGMLMRG
jgi:phage FluMu protein Com